MKDNRLFFLTILIGVSLFFVGSRNLSAAVPSIETKMTIETRLEERLRRVLTEITGTEKITVIVNVHLYTEKEEKEKPESLLPGVPVKKRIGEETRPFDLGDIKTLIKKLTVTIILDKGVSAKVVEVVKEVTPGLVGLDPERGDELIVQQMNFEKNPFFWGSLFYPPHLYWIIAIILAGLFIFASTIFLFGPFKNFATNMVAAIQTTRRSEEVRGETNERELPLLPVTPVAGTAIREETGIPGSSGPFSFLREGHLRNLLFLLRKEDPENIAVIINYLEPSLSSRVFSSLSPEIQSRVATYLSRISEMNPEQVKSLEEKIKMQIEYLIGGEDRLTEILEYSNKETQEKILNSLKGRDPQLANQIKSTLVNFEDIATFDPLVIQTIYRRSNPIVFAQVLKSVPEDVKKKVLSVLTSGAADRLRQEMELARPLTVKRIEEEKRKIIDLIRQLIREGIIEIKKRG